MPETETVHDLWVTESALRPLEGFVVGVTAQRRWQEQSDLLERRGATVVHGPTLAARFLADDEALRLATEDLVRSAPSFLVANTAVGMRSWLEAARAWGLYEDLVAALGRAVIIARGAKAEASMRAVGLEVAARAAHETLNEVHDLLLAHLVRGQRIAVQLHGAGDTMLAVRLEEAGAQVVRLPVYELELPQDHGPALRLITAACERRVDAVTFTSAPALHNLFTIARRHALDEELRRAFSTSVVASCVGPVCAEAARAERIPAPVAPEVGRLGLLIRALSDHLSERRHTFPLAGQEVAVQGSVALIDGQAVSLSARERAVLEILAERPGVVVGAAAIERRVWGGAPGRTHRLQVTVGRLRKRLGPLGDAVVAVPRRGYRIEPGSLGPARR